MSETPMSLIDDKKSSQVTYNTNQIMSVHESQRAFFEQAEQQIAQPPVFERFNLNEEPQPFNTAILAGNIQDLAEVPEYAKPPKTNEDNLKEIISHFTDRESLQAVATISTATVLLRRHN